jgi:hypothetical protein
MVELVQLVRVIEVVIGVDLISNQVEVEVLVQLVQTLQRVHLVQGVTA